MGEGATVVYQWEALPREFGSNLFIMDDIVITSDDRIFLGLRNGSKHDLKRRTLPN